MIGVVRIYRKQTQTVWGKDMQLLLSIDMYLKDVIFLVYLQW